MLYLSRLILSLQTDVEGSPTLRGNIHCPPFTHCGSLSMLAV